MAVAQTLLSLIILLSFCASFACCGQRILRLLSVEIAAPSDHFLVSTALGILAAETFLALAEFSDHVRIGSYLIVGVLAFFFLLEGRPFARQLSSLARGINMFSGIDRALFWLIVAAIAVEFLIASAPLTGSDAQNYHFTVPKLILERGSHPLFSITPSFLCGQHHSLILFGLALGSERLALGFIFLGGVLSAAVVARLSSIWATHRTVLIVTLMFLVTPVVFWQISNSGAPDIYMAFFLGAALLLLNQPDGHRHWQLLFVVGLLTGGVAGAKYSGAIIAVSLLIAVIWQFRRIGLAAAFVAGAVLGGISPYVRNFLWTGNPVFPFLSERLAPHLVSAYALRDLALNTGAAQHHPLLGLLPFELFARGTPGNLGFWDFFGPVVIALAPSILLAARNTRMWRIVLTVWLFSGAGLYFSSGLLRFLLPLYPLALACVAAGFECITERQWKFARSAALALFSFISVAGFGGLLVYAAKPIQAAIGLQTREAYLQENAQDYAAVQAINEALGGAGHQGNVFVFLRHLYYLRVPFISGDPANSFEADPARLDSADAWKRYFRARQITYVVRGARYPAALASTLTELERQGTLVPIEELQVKNLSGKRIDETVVTVPVVILKVMD